MILKYDRLAAQTPRPGVNSAPGLPRILLLALLLILPVLLAAEFQTHTVKKGDTLYALSKRYGVSVDQIKTLNNLAGNNLAVNQVLKIKELPPPPKPTPPPVAETVPATTPASSSGPRLDLPEEYYYTVQQKDNLYRISVNNKLSLNDLLKWNNFESETHVIHPGDKLIVRDPGAVPAGETVRAPEAPTTAEAAPAVPDSVKSVVVQKVYVVQKKDTLFRIAKNNGMTVDELKRLNNLTSNQISVGQKLYLVGSPDEPGSTVSALQLTEAELQKSDIIRTDLIKPTTGIVTSEFGLRGGRPHKGIDIASKTGTPIYAVLDGVVAFSGVQGGYGNVVVIEHPDFVMTVYAHNERNLVKANEQVQKGQMIAYMGSTGQSTGSHCHFEYRIKGKAINPRKVLPPLN